MTDRPKLLPSILELIKDESERRGVLALVPLALIICGMIGALTAWMIPDEFWNNERWDISTAVYAGLLTFSGLVLALGWNAFAKMYEILFRGQFGAYLYDNQLLNHYLVHISVMHFIQVAAVFVSGVGLMTVLFSGIPNWADRIVLAVVITAISFGLKQAVDAVTAMNDLVWQSAVFERHIQNMGASNNVRPLSERRS